LSQKYFELGLLSESGISLRLKVPEVSQNIVESSNFGEILTKTFLYFSTKFQEDLIFKTEN